VTDHISPLPPMQVDPTTADEADGADDGAFGVLVMAYGTPASPEDVEAYYTHIRRGRTPEPEQLADLVRRYEAIGGTSPLAERTHAQRAAIADALAAQGHRALVVLGQKHADPFIEDGVARLAAAGVGRVVGLVLAPHFSAASVGQYHERAETETRQRGLPYLGIDSWHDDPAYLDFLVAAVDEGRSQLPERHKVLFTAHSLPERVLIDDPYADQLRQSAAEVARRLGLNPWAGWGLAWQSAGRTPEPWRGPDILEVIRDLAETGRSDGVLVCAQGFTSDHLEVLYDVDVEARGVAEDVGLAFARTRSLNAEPAVMADLARRVATAAAAP